MLLRSPREKGEIELDGKNRIDELMEQVDKSAYFNKSSEKIVIKSETMDKIDLAVKRLINKPFAGYTNFKDCERQNSGKRNPAAYCASIMEATEKLDKAERPPKAGWDSCISRAGGIPSIKDPEAFCGDLWFNDRPKWDSFVKMEKDKWCGCPVNKTITAESIEKLDNAILRLLPLRGN